MQHLEREYDIRLGSFVDPDVERRYIGQRLVAARRTVAYLLFAMAVIPIVGVAVDLQLTGPNRTWSLLARAVIVLSFWVGSVAVRRSPSIDRASVAYFVAIAVGILGYTVIATRYFLEHGRSDHGLILGATSALFLTAHPQPRRAWPLVLVFIAAGLAISISNGAGPSAIARDGVTIIALASFGFAADIGVNTQLRTVFAFNERLTRAESKRRIDQEADADAARYALQRKDAEWRSIVDNAPVLVVLVDAWGAVSFANHHAQRVGFRANGRFLDVVQESATPAIDRLFSAGIRVDFEAIVSTPAGDLTFSFHAAPVGRTPPFEEATIVGIDVTRARQLTEELLAAQKQQTLGALAGGVAHDFNNLLMVITGATELLSREAPLEPEHREYLQDVLDAASRAANLTRQLLLVSRRNPTRVASIDPNRLLANMKKLLDRVIGVEVELRVELDETAPAVRADPSHLEQIVMNLVVNARDAMPGGGLVRLGTRHRGEGTELFVEDHGTGIDDSTRAHIFEPFFTTKAPSLGTGLGLATVKNVVGQLRGTIEVETALGRGTTFRVWLPAASAPESSETEPRDPPMATAKILVVDDDVAVRRLCSATLERAGHRVVAAEDLASAVEAVQSHPDIDLLLTDVRLPHAGGLEVATAVRALRPEVGVVFMSGFVQDPILLERIQSGQEVLLDKPFTAQALLTTLGQALQRIGAQRGAAYRRKGRTPSAPPGDRFTHPSRPSPRLPPS